MLETGSGGYFPEVYLQRIPDVFVEVCLKCTWDRPQNAPYDVHLKRKSLESVAIHDSRTQWETLTVKARSRLQTSKPGSGETNFWALISGRPQFRSQPERALSVGQLHVGHLHF